MHSIVLPSMGSPFGGNGPFALLDGLLGGVLFGLDAGLFGLDAAELLESGLAGVGDAVLRLAVHLLHLVGGAEGLRGRIEGALAPRGRPRRPPRRLLVLP